ncbi:DUF5050 domain-containing protein [Neobacillus sp. SCS-31]|uniref:DUF5050 domain-containing protein n=1 Tax=Neobacillus oceani TaxID=3115292 RepID=UPI00390678AD
MKRLLSMCMAFVMGFGLFSGGMVVNASGVNKEGNSANNIVNGGEVTKQGDWIYYVHRNGNRGLYKVKTNGTQNTYLNVKSVDQLNVIGDYVYFASMTENGKLYRIKTNGTGKQSLNVWGEYFVAVGNWIYFHNLKDDWKLYKVSLDGKKLVKISNDFAAQIHVVGNTIYYTNHSDGEKLYKIGVDGKNRVRINNKDMHIQNMTVYKGWIYYGANQKFYKMSVDGKKRILLSNDHPGLISVANDYVYYMKLGEKDGSVNDRALYRMKIDGTGKKRMVTGQTTNYNVVDGYIYYLKWDHNLDDGKYYHYRMKLDGTANQLFMGKKEVVKPVEIKEPELYVNNVLDKRGFHENSGVLYLPIDTIVKKRGYTYEYDEDYMSMTLTKNGEVMVIKLGKEIFYKDDEPYEVSKRKGTYGYVATPMFVNNHMYAPDDFFTKHFGAVVKQETVNGLRKVYVSVN